MNQMRLFFRRRSPFALFAGFVVSLLLPGPVSAAAPGDFAATRAVLSETIRSPQLVEARVDAALFAATRPGFPDLRLFDAAGTEWPRIVEPRYKTQSVVVRRAAGARATELRELPGNRIETRLELFKDQPAPAGLDIRTPLKDFIRTVRVSGSVDGQTWKPLVEDAEIFDYSRYMDVRRTEIPLPKNACRHFSIEIGNASEERAQPLVRLVQADGKDQTRALDLLRTPFRIDGISFWHDETTLVKDKPVLREWPHAGFAVTQNPKDKTTEILLQTARAPLTRIQIETPARNFQRDVSVMAATLARGQKTWRSIGKGQFTRVDLPGYSRNDLAIDFPEARGEELRLVIHNADNPPLEIDGIRPFGPVYRILWLAEPLVEYQLAYGNDELAPPTYDLFALRTALDKGIPPLRWQLAPPDEASPGATTFSLGEFFSRPAVFGTALALAALALLLLLAKALKKAA